MLKLTNIDYQLVVEMAEGDKEFEAELLEAIINSVKDLRKKYLDGVLSQNEEMIIQARHKIKPTLTLFGLERLSLIIENGKETLDIEGMKSSLVDKHQEEFTEAVDDLLEELSSF